MVRRPLWHSNSIYESITKSPASDQFALAVVAIQMLTSKPPLHHYTKTAVKQLEQWMKGDYDDIKKLVGEQCPNTLKKY